MILVTVFSNGCQTPLVVQLFVWAMGNRPSLLPCTWTLWMSFWFWIGCVTSPIYDVESSHSPSWMHYEFIITGCHLWLCGSLPMCLNTCLAMQFHQLLPKQLVLRGRTSLVTHEKPKEKEEALPYGVQRDKASSRNLQRRQNSCHTMNEFRGRTDCAPPESDRWTDGRKLRMGLGLHHVFVCWDTSWA